MRSRYQVLTAVAVVFGAAACQSSSGSLEPTESGPVPTFSQGSGNSGPGHYAKCDPIRPDSRHEDIDSHGGTLRIGPHTLTLLPGSVLRKTRITATITSSSVNSIQFQPEGLRFLVPAILRMSYGNCSGGLGLDMKVVYTSNDLLQILELIPSIDQDDSRTVIGFISHFSRYAVAY